jgi:hypothetical protein
LETSKSFRTFKSDGIESARLKHSFQNQPIPPTLPRAKSTNPHLIFQQADQKNRGDLSSHAFPDFQMTMMDADETHDRR